MLRADALTIAILLSTNRGVGATGTTQREKKTQRTRTNDNVPRDATAKVVKVEIFTCALHV